MKLFAGIAGAVLAGACAWGAGADAIVVPMADARAALRRAMPAVCPGGVGDPAALAERLGYGAVVGPSTGRGRPGRVVLSDPTQGRLTVVERRRGSRLDGYELQADVLVAGALRPVMMARLGPDCAVVLARAIDYGAGGRAKTLVDLNAALRPDRRWQPLDPPVPPGKDPGGVRVGHVDSGVNYLLSGVGGRLARRADGTIIGWDYWDDDPRPFDLNPAGSPFFPLHHGTAVASILLAEAPGASLVPFRYPRPDMRRMAALVDAAAAAGTGIVMVPMGSNRRAEWRDFAAAVARHPEVLFVVSAGNNGRDIDAEPIYPAAFELANLLVVTSADDFGRLAPGSNWGAESVAVTDHRGAAGRASGSSFAVPRVAALAARLKAGHPDWAAARLIDAIKARAAPPMIRGRAKVKFGWIANPTDDG